MAKIGIQNTSVVIIFKFSVNLKAFLIYIYTIGSEPYIHNRVKSFIKSSNIVDTRRRCALRATTEDGTESAEPILRIIVRV